MRCLWIALLLCSLSACGEDTDITGSTGSQALVQSNSPGVFPGEAVCDAGDEAFVRRMLPQLWGRHPASVRELDLMLQIIQQRDRKTLISAMMETEAFLLRWSEFVMDHLQINRVGERSGGIPMQEEAEATGTLAAFVRDNSPEGAGYDVLWSMTDLIESALILDDLSPVFRAQLFAMLGSKIINLDNPGANLAWRQVYGEIFERTYLNRRMECLQCHNSEFSVTGSSDPTQDRTWEVPGLFEKALFEQSHGRASQELWAFFRVEGVLSMRYVPEGLNPTLYWDYAAGHSPWGMNPELGQFELPNEIEKDPEGWVGYLIKAKADRPSIWDVEQMLRAGFTSLRASGLQVAANKSVEGEQALGWMVSMSLVDNVWLELTGHRLTAPHFFPRNQYQRDVLIHLTQSFVSNGFSLKSVLREALLHPYFNPGLPSQCPGFSTAYNLAPVFDPWVVDHSIETLRLNNVGDSVARLPPRVLIEAVSAALGWPLIDPEGEEEEEPQPGDDEGGPKLTEEVAFLSDIGVYLMDGTTGFRGNNIVESLAWEEALGDCRQPFVDAEEMSADWIDRLQANAPVGTSMEALVIALKDRLLSRPVLEDKAERSLIEQLMGMPLTTPLQDATGSDLALRRICAAFLASPDFQLAGAPGPNVAGTQTTLTPEGSSSVALCAELVDQIFEPGQASCTSAGAIELK